LGRTRSTIKVTLFRCDIGEVELTHKEKVPAVHSPKFDRCSPRTGVAARGKPVSKSDERLRVCGSGHATEGENDDKCFHATKIRIKIERALKTILREFVRKSNRVKKLLFIGLFLAGCSSSNQPSSTSGSIQGVWHEGGATWLAHVPDSIWTLDILPDSCRLSYVYKNGGHVADTEAAIVTADSLYISNFAFGGVSLGLGLHGDSLIGVDQGMPVSFGR